MTLSTPLKFAVLFIFTLLAVGCSTNYYNVPRETYEQRVRIIGVAPLFVDGESDIRHPEKDTLVSLLKDHNRRNEQELVARLRGTGSYFNVQFLSDDADKLFSTLMFRRERRDDAGIVYNKYFYRGPELKETIRKNGVDAIMLVTVSGLTMHDKVRSSNLLEYLETDYNNLIITGQVLDPDGNILWEYPNFRQRTLSFPYFFQLQFPDFDEARANVTDKVDLKYKTIPGINRALSKTETSSSRKNATVSVLYEKIFDDMISMLKPEFDWFGLTRKERPAPAAPSNQPQQLSPTPQPQQAPATASPAPVAETTPRPGTTAPSTGNSGETISSPPLAPAN